MDLKLRTAAFNSFHLPVAVVDQQYIYVEECETSGPLVVSLKSNADVNGAHDAEMATASFVGDSEVTDFAHFDNDTAIAAVEEISDGEQKQEIESVIEVINIADTKFPEYERNSYRVRKGRRKRHWSYEWQNLCGGSSAYDQSDESLNSSTANALVHRKPKKRLFAHR